MFIAENCTGQPCCRHKRKARLGRTDRQPYGAMKNLDIICCFTLLHDHTCLLRVHQKKHRLFGFSSCRDRGNGKKRHKKSASFAIWGLPHVQASLEQAEHHSTLFLCFAAYFSAVFRPISRSSSGQDTWNAACLLSPFHKSQQSHTNAQMLC